MKKWLKIFLAVGVPLFVVITVFFILDLTDLPIFGGAVWTVLFIALYVVFAGVIIKTLITARKTSPARLERHLYAISEKERNVIFRDFSFRIFCFCLRTAAV